MFLIAKIQNIIYAGTQQLISWVTGLLPQVFLFLVLLNAVTRLIGRARVEKLAARCGSNAFLRYLVLPFLSAVILGNPMAISMGRYLPERYKPAYFASASYHCHTNSGLFHHINPAELFIWLGIANGLAARGLDPFPLALRYLCAGLIANLVSGWAAERITERLSARAGIRLEDSVDLQTGGPETADADTAPLSGSPAQADADADTAPLTGDPAPADADADAALLTGGPAPADIDPMPGSLPAFRSITIECGDGGWGGPVMVTPTIDRHTVLYMTGGGLEPEPLARILSLSGMTAVNGNTTAVPDEEVALAIIDCGGTLRCGLFPRKGIPTVNLLATGRSGPLAKYITADLYVSAVTSAQVSLSPALSPDEGPDEELLSENPHPDLSPRRDGFPEVPSPDELKEAPRRSASPEALSPAASLPGQSLPEGHSLLGPAAAMSRIVSVFHQSARDAVRTCLDMLLPFMGFAALFVGLCRGSGLTELIASALQPMGGSLPGLLGLGIICSVPGLSAVLGAGAVAAQMFSTVIGDLIASGSIAPAMALPALFAVNCQCACDFIPVGLSMTEARPETTQIGITAVTLSRFATGWIRILIALAFSIGLYR
ncbi:MAG: hypothetical protein IJH93_00470 [Lachnospiraceae bacterium]|nr:hypothetical protein [Lachnospiraceae bacterium]